jgi:hypothetical protein
MFILEYVYRVAMSEICDGYALEAAASPPSNLLTSHCTKPDLARI